MEPKELLGLYEAYQQVYEPQELTEEVEIATEYFYEMGLNENGIDILIEELGEEEFVNWVYDIAEEYTLSEATQTRLQRMADAKGKIVTGPKGSRPQSTTKAAIKKMGGITKRISSSQRPGSTISGKREKAVSTAVSQQSPTSSTPQQTRTGIAGRLGAAFGGAVKRAKSDIELVRKTGQTVAKAVRTGVEGLNTASDSRLARQARVQVKKGLKRQQKAIDTVAPVVGRAAGKAAAQVPAIRNTYRAGQQLGRALKREEYEYILEHLLDEGYAESIENAEKIVMNMSEAWIESIVEEILDEAVRGSGRSIGDRITGNDIRGVTRGNKSVYKKPKWKDDVENKVDREVQLLSDRKKKRESEMAAGRLTVATKRGIEKATNRSNDGPGGDEFAPGSALRRREEDDQPTDYRARRRRASGR
jgi:hypothetical protein